jgi:2-iminobutanoate/2-iminopropanoate deaminase
MPTERQWQPVPQGAGIAAPAGAYSPGIRAGDFIFVSGQIPKDPVTGALVTGSVAEQTRQVIRNVQGVLEAAGAALSDLVAINVYLSDPGMWGEFNEAYLAALDAPYPTRTTVGAGLRGIDVEISGVAYRPAVR